MTQGGVDDYLRSTPSVDELLGLDALHLVLTITLDRESVARCAGMTVEDSMSLWPSSLYRLVAVAALSHVHIWGKCEEALNAVLGPLEPHLIAMSPFEIASMFGEHQGVLPGRDMAQVLWSLLSRRCPAASLVAQRLGQETSRVAMRRMLAG